MSVHRDRTSWRVKWRDTNGTPRSRSFTRKDDAQRFDARMTRARQLGPALMREIEREGTTLGEFVRTGFRAHAVTLARPTRAKYAWALEKHLAELVDEPLLCLDVPRLVEHQEFLLEHGRNATTIREVFTRLSGIMQIAVEHGYLPGNPVRAMRKVPAEAREEPWAMAPVELEQLLARLTGRSRALCLLAGHLGLRPLEARMAPWSAFDGEALVIGRARTKKTAARTRVIAVPEVTAHELKAWRLESGGRGDQPIAAITPNAMRLWTKRVLRAHASKVCGRDDVTLYTLRHTHASACHYAGYTVPEAAERLGHGPGLHVETYAHVIKAIRGQRYADLDALIADARNLMFRQSSASADRRLSDEK